MSEPLNYFNYFTEIEEQFQKTRGTSLFLLSPLDWALIESWKESGVPLEAVMRGIEISFEKWRAKKTRAQLVNSLAYCSQAVLAEAQRMADGGGDRAQAAEIPPVFENDELRRFMLGNAATIRATGVAEYSTVADSLEELTAQLPPAAPDLEKLEATLTVLEQKMVALARGRQSDEEGLANRSALESQLRAYKNRMSAPQLQMLETQFLQRALLESAHLPRLSLFYLYQSDHLAKFRTI